MRKRVLADSEATPSATATAWLDPRTIDEVEISSEDPAHPIEDALLVANGGGWRAALPGRQTIRLRFATPQPLELLRLRFVDSSAERTQEYLLRWSADNGQSYREIVRQQWNFNPQTAACECEEHRVELAGVTVLELTIDPDLGNPHAFASLAEFRVA